MCTSPHVTVETKLRVLGREIFFWIFNERNSGFQEVSMMGKAEPNGLSPGLYPVESPRRCKLGAIGEKVKSCDISAYLPRNG